MRGWLLFLALVGCHPSSNLIVVPVRDGRVQLARHGPDTETKPGEVAILDPNEAPDVLQGYECVESVSVYWRPGEELVATIDAKLDEGLRERGLLAAYHRRYSGVESNGKHIVCVSATTVEATARAALRRRKPFDWRHEAFEHDDLDIVDLLAGFTAGFDVARNRFIAFTPHPFMCALSVHDADMERNRACGRDPMKFGDSCDQPTTDKAVWRRVAEMYSQWLDDTLHRWILPGPPGSREAPLPAMRAAFAYKRAGDYDAAISVYRRFLDGYGDPDKMRELEKNDPKQYTERVAFLHQASDELATTYFASFRYAEARATYEAMANDARFDPKARGEARRNADTLTKALGR